MTRTSAPPRPPSAAAEAPSRRPASRRALGTSPALRWLCWLAIVLLAAAVLAPLVTVLWRLFIPLDQGYRDWWTALSNPRNLDIVRNTLLFVVGAGSIGGIVGCALAVLVTRTDVAGVRRLGEMLPIMSLLMPPMVGALGWVFLGARQAGLLNVLFRLLPGVGEDAVLINTQSPLGVILVGAIYIVPFAYLYTVPALQQVPAEMEGAARVHGASARRTMLRITLPVVRPALLSAGLIVLMVALSEFAVPLVLGTPVRFDVLTTRIWSSIRTSYPPDYATAATLGTLLLIPAFLGLFAQRRFSRGQGRFEVVVGRSGSAGRLRLGIWRVPATIFVWGYVAVAVVLPVAAVVIVSLNPFWSGNFHRYRLSLENLRWVAESKGAIDAILDSLGLAAEGATIGAFTALLICYLGIRTQVRGRSLLEYIATIPMGVPNSVYALGFFILYLTLGPTVGLYGSRTGLVVAYVVITIPLAVRAVASGMYQIDRELEEAGRLAGARPRTVVLRIVLPLLVGFLASAWVLQFVLMFRELPISVFLASRSGNSVVSSFLLDTYQNGLFPKVAAFSIYLFLINVVVVAALFRLQRSFRGPVQ